MTDYKATGLDPNLMPKDGIGTAIFESGYGFDAGNERGAVSSMHLKTITADKIYGGTLTLGGLDNGNGEFILKDSSGSTIIVGNNAGISVTTGAGTAIIDGTGLNSINNFELGAVNNINSFNTTSGTYVNIPGGTIGTITLSRDARVLLTAKLLLRNSGVHGYGYQGTVRILDSYATTSKMNVVFSGESATDIDWDNGTGLINSEVNWSISQTYSGVTLFNFDAGTHVLTLQMATEGGTAYLSDGDVGYVVLGI